MLAEIPILAFGLQSGELLPPYGFAIKGDKAEPFVSWVRQHNPPVREVADWEDSKGIMLSMAASGITRVGVVGSYAHYCIAHGVVAGLHAGLTVLVPENLILYGLGKPLRLPEHVTTLNNLAEVGLRARYDYTFVEGNIHLFQPLPT